MSICIKIIQYPNMFFSIWRHVKDFLESIGLNISTVIANFEIKVEKMMTSNDGTDHYLCAF